jgi:hypothetical protein
VLNLGLIALAILAGLQDRSALIASARNPEAALADRIAAIRELRVHSQNNDEVARLLRDLASNESEAIRRRAVQSLGWIVGNPRCRPYAATVEALKKVYEGDSSPSVRAMALKALHFATHPPEAGTFRSWMIGLARDRALKTEVRVAAAWALATASTYADVTPALKSLFQDSAETPEVRAQALKSLHLLMADRECWEPALQVAEDIRQDLDLREAAVLFLWSAKSRESSVKDALTRLAADFPERIRKAAVMSLDESLWNRPEILKYFRFRNDPILRRPIEVLELE